MDCYTPSEKRRIWDIAFSSISLFFNNQSILPPKNQQDSYLLEKRGTFVTLTIHSKLRGCIGSLLPQKALWKDVSENAIHAAFHDPRFPPLSIEELSILDLEISILTIPNQINPNSPLDLFNLVKPGKDGVILQSGYNKATFLPQVWEDIPDPKKFFQQLCLKAGLNQPFFLDCFSELTFYTYQVEIVKKDWH